MHSRRFLRPPAVLRVAALLGLTAHVAGAALQVWTVTETRHVLRSEPPGNRREAKLAVARNEWGSFQILLRSEAPVRVLDVKAGELRGPDGEGAGAIRWRFYRQHQLHLDAGTHRNSDFNPDWYPDPLIPFAHPTAGERLENARFKAVPFDLPAGETHGFWVDLEVPSHAVAGEYRGTCQVIPEPGRASEIPVVLTVWDFSLPPVPALQTEFGSPAARLRSYHRDRAQAGQGPQPTNWARIEAQCAALLSEHRLNAVPPGALLRPVAQPDGSFRIPPDQVQALREFIERYHVNALPTPHPSSAVQDPTVERDKLRAWLAAFDRAAAELGRPGLLFYTYLRDEPNTLEDYRYVQKWGRAVRDARSVVKVLVVEQTWTAPGQGGADSAWGDLDGAVDIWCPLFSLHRPESAAARQALGETIWTYTALCQGEPTPWWHIDFPLLNYRVPTWMAWRHRMRGLLYWGGLSYWERVEDPWQQAPYYAGSGAFQQGQKGIRFNGEGSLVYPARAVGYEGIVPTIRLKALRDAIEDYDYLALLEGLGQTAEAEAVVRPLADSFFRWDKDPAAYETARARLAALILHAATHPPVPAWFPQAPPLPPPRGETIHVSTADELLAAADRVGPGGTVLLADGQYRLPRVLVLEGKKDIVLRGASGDPARVVLSGQGWHSQARNDDLIHIGRCEGVTVADLTFADCRSYGLKVEAENAPRDIHVYNCRFRDIGVRAIKGSAGQDPGVRAVRGSVRYCQFENTKVPPADWLFGGDYISAIDMMALEDWTFSDNVFRNVRGRQGGGRAALFIWVRSRRVVVERNLIVGCDRGVAFGNPGQSTANLVGERLAYVTDGVIRNNFIAGGPDCGIELWHAERIQVGHNTIWRPEQNWSRGIRVGTGTARATIVNNLVHGEIRLEGGEAELRHNLTGRLDGYFVDPASGNLALTPAATGALGQGVFLPEVTDDIRGRRRANPPDLGAWETAIPP